MWYRSVTGWTSQKSHSLKIQGYTNTIIFFHPCANLSLSSQLPFLLFPLRIWLLWYLLLWSTCLAQFLPLKYCHFIPTFRPSASGIIQRSKSPLSRNFSLFSDDRLLILDLKYSPKLYAWSTPCPGAPPAQGHPHRASWSWWESWSLFNALVMLYTWNPQGSSPLLLKHWRWQGFVPYCQNGRRSHHLLLKNKTWPRLHPEQ